MKRIVLYIWYILALAGLALGQFTTVTGTVTDPNGLAYSFGTIASTIVASGTPLFSSNSQPYLQPSQATSLDINGKFVVRLADNTQISPGGSTWTFLVCSAAGTVQPAFGTGPRCFTVTGVTISGASQDITSTLNASALALTATFAAGGVTGTGTANRVAIWTSSTALGNSQITNATGQIQLGFGGNALTVNNPITSLAQLTGTCAGGTISNASSAPSSPTCGSTFTFQASSATGTSTGLWIQYQGGNGTTLSGKTGLLVTVQGGSGTVTEERAIDAEAFDNTAATVTTRRGLYALAGSNGNGGTASEAIVAQNWFTGTQTETNDYGIHVLSPVLIAGATLTHHYGLFIEDQTVAGSGTNSDPHGITVVAGGIQHKPTAFASLPACNATWEGTTWAVNNSTVNTFGSTIAGGGTNHVNGYCDGTNWTVAAN